MIEVTEISETDNKLIDELKYKIQVSVSEIAEVGGQLIDDAIFGHIQRIATEEGMKLDVKLNRNFIIEALTNRYENTVKHGKWISHEGYEECNLCHRKVTFPYNYCPNCGARMDGE